MNAHGKSQFQPMLQLFEGYLDKKDVGDEARYDKVREGAIVFLGTLARHLDPSDAKVLHLCCLSHWFFSQHHDCASSFAGRKRERKQSVCH